MQKEDSGMNGSCKDFLGQTVFIMDFSDYEEMNTTVEVK